MQCYKLLLTGAMISSLLLIGSCSQQDDLTSVDQLVMLQKNRDLWRAQALQSYRYNFSRSCYCLPEYTRPVMMHYRDGQLDSVVYADDLTVPTSTNYPSIEDLFTLIREAIDRGETSMYVEYHPQFGYPTMISRDPNRQTVDDEISYHVNDVEINGVLYTRARPSEFIKDSTEFFQGAQFDISDAAIEAAGVADFKYDRLILSLNTISSCGSSYFSFGSSTVLVESAPPQAHTTLTRSPLADDVCDTPQTYQVVVDLTPYRKRMIENGEIEVVLLVGPYSLAYAF